MHKRIKTLLLVLAMVVLFFAFCSCSEQAGPKFLNSLDEVCRIDIVIYQEAPDAPERALYQEWLALEPAPKVLKTLTTEEREEVATVLKTIKGGKIGMDVDRIQVGAVGLMLTYTNGDYEILTVPAVFQHREEDNRNWRQAGYYVDGEVLNQLIKDYS